MRAVSSGKRYAQALFELALERGELENWRACLNHVDDTLADGKLMSILENPRLSFEAKKVLLNEHVGTMEPLVANLAYLLMTKGKLRILGDISRHYERLLDRHHGIAHAEVLTAVPLHDEEVKRFSTLFTELAGNKVIIDSRIDPSIMGGFKAKIGDVLIDGSIRNALESMKKKLALSGKLFIHETFS
jgi:F-type H+-transporting ATPase subunit delta